MKRKIGLLLLAGWLIFAGCGLIASKDPLSGSKWQLETLAGVSPVMGSVVTMEFADQRLSGSAGCNSYGSGYEIDGNQLIFDAVAMTEMACADEAVMGQEANFTNLLGQVNLFKSSSERLELFDGNGNSLMTFIPRS